MKKADNIKISVALSLLLAVSACSHNKATQSESVVIDPELIPEEQTTASMTDWQRYYGKQQERHENTLADDNINVQTDLWQRIRLGFALTPATPLNKATQRELDRFLKNPHYLERLTERARPYLHYIVSELEKRDMPMELALLPAVESGFKPQVYSRSGAAGIWQFMPATGKVFGLEQNWWYDGRRDIVASTDAALTYLKKLHGYFGDWQLAVAAYNAGEGTVGRAIKKNEAEGKATDFWSLSLPKETVKYIPKLMALSHLVLQPNHYGRTLPVIKNQPVFEVVNIGSQMDLSMAAEMAQISHDELHQFNPGFNQWATAPEGPHQLVLPLEKAAVFRQQLAGLSEHERMRWQRHKIARGESLSGIATRYKTTVAVLKKANKLSSHRIRAGKYLIIPSPAHTQLAQAEPMPTSQATGKKSRIHIVKKGDTWWDLAKTYNVGVQQLAQWNGKKTEDTLRLGQKLTVKSVAPPVELANKTKVHYEIQHGDSLWKISRQFNVSVAEVKAWNGLSSRVLLQPGQMLKLYVK